MARTVPAVPGPPNLPLETQDYYGLLRTPRFRWWKGLLAAVLLVGGGLVVNGVLDLVGLVIDLVTGAVTVEDLRGAASGVIPFGPGLFIANNVGLALLIPLAMLLNLVFFGQGPGWIASVAGRFRWRWTVWCLLVVGLPWFALLAVSLLLDGTGLPAPDRSAWLVLGLTLLTTPLQCAGEEWAFRGFLPRCLATIGRRPRVATGIAVVLSSAVFAVAHSAADPWLNAFYFCLGLVLCALTWRTGGLEASVVLHTVNNLTGLVPVVLTGDYSSIGDRSAGSGSPWTLLPLVLGVGLVFLVEWVRRRRGVARTAAPGLDRLPPPAPSLPPAGDSEIGGPGDTLGPYEHRDQPPGPVGEQRP